MATQDFNSKPAPIQNFLNELAKLNALARLIEEGPIPAERVDHFYRVFQDASNSGQDIQRIMTFLDFEEALMALTDKAAFLKAHVRYFAPIHNMTEAEFADWFYTEADLEIINGAR